MGVFQGSLPNSLPNIWVQEIRFGERQNRAVTTPSLELGLNRQRLIGGGEGGGPVHSREVPLPLTRGENGKRPCWNPRVCIGQKAIYSARTHLSLSMYLPRSTSC